ncbi:TRAP transporter large permease [Paracoccus nototheniae]|uniref:TRAP transporter large permease n=1 Tax=Paracoccus nototheniae TaxID=2489002 RepID=A0ABW4DTL5_9RHOB|nr:TRAP transporter large permease [Paracoccus nototheniae]
MAPVTVGLAAMVTLLLMAALRVPIALALAGVASAGSVLIFAGQGGSLISGAAFGQTGVALAADVRELLSAPDLWMVPLVIALGNIALCSGIATRIYDAAVVWLHPLRGGMAMASLLGCGGFAALSGSSIACASTMGRICVPEMVRQGYDPRLAAGSVAVGGTLGSLIPPSVLFILYGVFTQTPVAQLFLAGILPGFLSLAGMLAVVVWWVGHDPKAAPRPEPRQKGATRAEAAWAAWPPLLLFAVIVGGILSGLFSATAAAAVAVVLAIGIGFAQGRLTPDVLWHAIRDSVMQSGAILLIAVAAKVFLGFVALTGLSAALVAWVADAQIPFAALMLGVVVVYLLLGMVLDPLGILVLTLPFVAPLVQAYDLNLIWFGVIVVKLLEIGLITPPVGLNVFVVSTVTPSVGIGRIFEGVGRFLAVDILVLALLVLFPVLSLALPGMIR